MQAVRGGRLALDVLLHVLEVLLVRQVRRRLEAGVERDPLHQLLPHVRLQEGCAQPPVPVVGDVATVHDLAEEVPQVVPRDLRVGLEVVVGHRDAHHQVAGVEGVAAVPPHRAKLPALADHRVEEAQREDDRLELALLGRALPDGRVKVLERAQQVRLEPARRLVGQLDRLLKDWHRHHLLRHRREEDAELGVGPLLQRRELLLQLGQPVGDELDVLEHDPPALNVALVQRLLRDGLLPLTERHPLELALVLGLAHRFSERAYVGSRIDAGREQEEDGHRWPGVLEREEQVKVDGGAVLCAEDLLHPPRDGQRHAVRPHGADDEELVEAAQLLPLLRQRVRLGLLELAPLLPPLPRALHVRRQRRKLLDGGERLNGAPGGVGQPRLERILLRIVARVADEQHELVALDGRLALVVGLAQQHLDGELRRKDEPVPLEEPTGHEAEDGVSDRVLQVRDALLDRLGRLRLC
mmetsp:Transcript_13834/g.40682  ORF Transcript_13834/g.40682 Transcript_13834/m.40682 type:complete len:468 (+) Transcript_13834:1061-2464(+)